jgi:hypothetical protein
MSRNRQGSCRCQKKKSRHSGSPKIAGSMCHLSHTSGGYHAAVRERIEGKREVREALREAS